MKLVSERESERMRKRFSQDLALILIEFVTHDSHSDSDYDQDSWPKKKAKPYPNSGHL
jgi:hypothetical protein